jgi:hypothetical protein
MFLLFMTISTHQGTAFSAPVNIIFMTSDTLFMERRQKGNRDLFCQLFFVASGALAPFSLISVGKDIEIMVANPAPNNGFVYIMVKSHWPLMVFAKFPAFEIHDSCIGLFILGPSH